MSRQNENRDGVCAHPQIPRTLTFVVLERLVGLVFKFSDFELFGLKGGSLLCVFGIDLAERKVRL